MKKRKNLGDWSKRHARLKVTSSENGCNKFKKRVIASRKSSGKKLRKRKKQRKTRRRRATSPGEIAVKIKLRRLNQQE